MNPREYRAARPGLRVRTNRPMRNGWGTIPAGTVMTVTYKRSGFTLTAEPCAHCGMQPSIAGVHADAVAVEPTPEEAKP